MMSSEEAPHEFREGVRSGILTALQRDVELRGGRSARLLVAAGVLGVAGALGVTLLVSTHPFDHHPPWHLFVFSTVWAGLLVVALAIALLQIRTPTLPLARSAAVGVLGLGIAGACGAACPDPHFLGWWSGTGLGEGLVEAGGLAASALCFGFVTALFIAAIAALPLLADRSQLPVRPLLPAAALAVLLAPGVALQSVDTSFGVLAGWLFGTTMGAYLGVAGATWLGARLLGQRAE